MGAVAGAMDAGWRAARRIVVEARDDRISAEAARSAYYFFLSFFPAIITLFALTGIFGGNRVFSAVMEHLRAALPGDASTYLERFVREITGERRPGMLSLGLLLTFWSASTMFAVLADALNVMYDIDETRSWWRRRAVGVVALAVSLACLLVGTVSLLAGPRVAAEAGLGVVWRALRWPLAFVLVAAMMWLIYLLLPARDQHGALAPTAAGAVVGASLWVATTFGFRLYVTSFGRFSATYGFVGGIIVLLIWLYLTALAILFGGEVAATLEQMRDAAGDGRREHGVRDDD